MNPYHLAADAVRYQWFTAGHRQTLVARYAWAIPNDNAISIIAQMSPIIEMGAGNGYWASLIASAGGSIEAFDGDPGKHHQGSTSYLWYDVQIGGVERITERHHSHTLLLVWPPYDDPFAYNALSRFIEVGGKRVIFVGEPYGGCTADDAFFDLLDQAFNEVHMADIPQWWGVNDRMTVYTKKER